MKKKPDYNVDWDKVYADTQVIFEGLKESLQVLLMGNETLVIDTDIENYPPRVVMAFGEILSDRRRKAASRLSVGGEELRIEMSDENLRTLADFTASIINTLGSDNIVLKPIKSYDERYPVAYEIKIKFIKEKYKDDLSKDLVIWPKKVEEEVPF